MTRATAAAYRFHNNHPGEDDFYREVIAAFSKQPRCIPPKYFYDDAGSQLFEAICRQPEYYLTRTETKLLVDYADEIASLTGSGCYLIEPGSGNCEKVRHLLDAMQPATYVPMDISCDHLQQSAHCIASDYSWLHVQAVCTDITSATELPFIPGGVQRIVFYPGSSIGNFEPRDALEYLRELGQLAGTDGGLLIGVDLQKNSAVLDAAYNDASGVTADFNLNLLHRINRELDGDIPVNAFRHHAFYNETESRIEMHLVSECELLVHVNEHRFRFEAGESIHTENSYKYSVSSFRDLAEWAGFRSEAVWTDEAELFSLHLLRAIDCNKDR